MYQSAEEFGYRTFVHFLLSFNYDYFGTSVPSPALLSYVVVRNPYGL